MEFSDIVFTFEGKSYSLPSHAYENAQFIVLPNKRVLEILGWYETLPPKPNIKEVNTGELIYWAKENE